LEVQLRGHHTREFSQHLIIDAAAKEILRGLLEACGYGVKLGSLWDEQKA